MIIFIISFYHNIINYRIIKIVKSLLLLDGFLEKHFTYIKEISQWDKELINLITFLEKI